MKKNIFTLIELFIVVAVIVILRVCSAGSE